MVLGGVQPAPRLEWNENTQILQQSDRNGTHQSMFKVTIIKGDEIQRIGHMADLAGINRACYQSQPRRPTESSPSGNLSIIYLSTYLSMSSANLCFPSFAGTSSQGSGQLEWG